jgi:hypothetical protein
MKPPASPGVLRLARYFYIGLAVIALVEIAAPYLLHTEHGHFWFEDLPAWGSLYGVVACMAIIVVSKLLGKVWLARPEHYYDR